MDGGLYSRWDVRALNIREQHVSIFSGIQKPRTGPELSAYACLVKVIAME